MAPTLSFFKQPKLHFHDKAPPTSPLAQMPNVFVVPPEEDQSPSWCYFDAAEAPPLKPVLSTPPDLDCLHNALHALYSEPPPPVFNRQSPISPSQVIMPMKRGEVRLISDVLMNSRHDHTGERLDLLLQSESTQVTVLSENNLRGKRTTEDPVVLDVVKLRRHEEEHIAISPARSFKSRASKAFRSLKNVGKNPMRSRLSSSAQVGDDLSSRENKSVVSRRSPATLSQSLPSTATLKTRTSVSSFRDGDQRAPHYNSVSLEEKIPMLVTSYNHNSASPNPAISDLLDPSLSSSSCHDSVRRITGSPSPTSVRTFPNRRRFSMISLQRLFNFSSSDHDSEVSGSGSTTPTSLSMSRDSSGPSAASSLWPDTPTEGAPSFQLPLQLHLPSDDKHFLVTSDDQSAITPALETGDLSFEMQLDSLHFENLSFDASRF
jgi:hypothetical protein